MGIPSLCFFPRQSFSLFLTLAPICWHRSLKELFKGLLCSARGIRHALVWPPELHWALPTMARFRLTTFVRVERTLKLNGLPKKTGFRRVEPTRRKRPYGSRSRKKTDKLYGSSLCFFCFSLSKYNAIAVIVIKNDKCRVSLLRQLDFWLSLSCSFYFVITPQWFDEATKEKCDFSKTLNEWMECLYEPNYFCLSKSTVLHLVSILTSWLFWKSWKTSKSEEFHRMTMRQCVNIDKKPLPHKCWI